MCFVSVFLCWPYSSALSYGCDAYANLREIEFVELNLYIGMGFDRSGDFLWWCKINMIHGMIDIDCVYTTNIQHT